MIIATYADSVKAGIHRTYQEQIGAGLIRKYASTRVASGGLGDGAILDHPNPGVVVTQPDQPDFNTTSPLL